MSENALFCSWLFKVYFHLTSSSCTLSFCLPSFLWCCSDQLGRGRKLITAARRRFVKVSIHSIRGKWNWYICSAATSWISLTLQMHNEPLSSVQKCAARELSRSSSSFHQASLLVHCFTIRSSPAQIESRKLRIRGSGGKAAASNGETEFDNQLRQSIW